VGSGHRIYAGEENDRYEEIQCLPSVLSYDDVRAVSPALEHYTKGPLLDGLWKRPELSPRDRSIVTVAALIARIQTIEMPFHFALALHNGVKPSELSEIITHLAFYSGWANAMSAVAVAKDIFRQRGIGVDQLPPAKEKLLPLNQEAEKQRATQVSSNFGATSPRLVENTTNLLFLDLWLRPALAPRDRSLVTVSALIAAAQVAQIMPQLREDEAVLCVDGLHNALPSFNLLICIKTGRTIPSPGSQ
jgi:4-carboxymuconolactone decarboxylase